MPVNPELLVAVNDIVHRTLREAILLGKFRPGDRLLQDELAAQLRVSRQPVREALRRLQSEGLVVPGPHRGMLVRAFTEEHVQENYHLRQLLESEAARLAAQTIRPEELQELKSLNQAMAKAGAIGDISGLVEPNVQFHRLVWKSGRMETLVRLLDQLWVGRTIFTPLFIPGRGNRSVIEHAELITALEERNPEKAASAMRAHIHRAAEEYFGQRGHFEADISRNAV